MLAQDSYLRLGNASLLQKPNKNCNVKSKHLKKPIEIPVAQDRISIDANYIYNRATTFQSRKISRLSSNIFSVKAHSESFLCLISKPVFSKTFYFHIDSAFPQSSMCSFCSLEPRLPAAPCFQADRASLRRPRACRAFPRQYCADAS